MQPIFDAFSWVWDATGLQIVRDSLLLWLNYIQSWLQWLFDLDRILAAGLYVFTTLWSWIHSFLPDVVTTQFDAFGVFLQNAQVSKLLSVVFWVADQFCYVSVVKILFGLWFVLIPIFLIARWVVWILHQLWGSGDGQ